MKRIVAFLVGMLVFPAYALAPPDPPPGAVVAPVTPPVLVVTTGSGASPVTLLADTGTFPFVTIVNVGANEIFCQDGGVTVTASTSVFHVSVPAGGYATLWGAGNGYVACVTATSTATARFYQTNGAPQLGALLSGSSGGGSGGAVTIIDGGAVTIGTTTDVAWVSGAGTLVALQKAIDRDVLLVNAKLPALGQHAAAGSISVVLASDQGGVPVTGTFWQATQPVSGTFWQATQPVSGTFFQATQPVSGAASSFADGALVTLGTEADSACATDNGTCTAVALLKRGNQRDTSIITALGSPFQAGGNIGNAFALDTSVGTTNTDLGPPGATACATDTGSCAINALAQRIAQRLTTINTTLGTPLQAGGTVVVTGVATSANQTAVQTPMTPGTATATVANAIGAVYNTAPSTWTNTQQGGLQANALGALEIGTGTTISADAAAATANVFGGPTGAARPLGVMDFLYNGSGSDRAQEVITGTNSTGTGISAVGLLAQFDDVSPTSITENLFGNLRMSANRNLYGTIRDAAGNERGMNVDSHNSGQFVQYDSSGNPIDFTQNISVAPGPGGRVDVSCSTGNVAAATATCTMPATTGKTTYVTGFDITGSGATVGTVVTCTLTNVNSGTHSYTLSAVAGALVMNTPLIKSFVGAPLKATASNTAPVLSCPSLGTGNTNMTINVDGYEL